MTSVTAVPLRKSAALGDFPSYVALALFALFLRWPFFGSLAADYDEQLYQLIGQQMLHGALPFVDIWDRKPIGLFLIYAFSNAIGGPGPLPYQILACCSAILGGVLVYHVARRFADRVGGCVAGLVYLLFLSAYGAYVGQSEVFFIPMLLGMTILAIRIADTADRKVAHRLACGMIALGGLCLQIKYTVLPQCLFFGLIALGRQWQLRTPFPTLAVRALLYGLIGLLPTLAAAGFYAAVGHFDAFVYANFLSIFSRGHLTGPMMESYRIRVALMAAPLVVAALAGIALHIRHHSRMPLAYVIVIGWTGSAFISFILVGNIYIHYFASVIPGLAILGAPALGMTRSGALLSGLVLFFGFLFFDVPGNRVVVDHNQKGFLQTVDAIRPFISGKKGACLYVFDGPTSLYRDTNSCLPTIYVYPDHLSNSMEAGAIGVDTAREVSRILAGRPPVIVTASKPIVPRYNPQTAALVNAAVNADYVRVGAYKFFPRRLYVNVRRDLVKTAR